MGLKTTDGIVSPRRPQRQHLTENGRREIVQSWMPVWAFKLLNLTFISFMQSIILFLLAAPAYPIMLSTQFRSEVDALDLAFVSLELVLITTEWFADQQQWGRSIPIGGLTGDVRA